MGALYEIRKQRLSNRYRLFMQYMKLCKQNNRKLAYGLTEEIAHKEFDEEFLKILIFSEKKTEILKRHMAEIEKEISEIFPHDNDKAREEIRTFYACDKCKHEYNDWSSASMCEGLKLLEETEGLKEFNIGDEIHFNNEYQGGTRWVYQSGEGKVVEKKTYTSFRPSSVFILD